MDLTPYEEDDDETLHRKQNCYFTCSITRSTKVQWVVHRVHINGIVTNQATIATKMFVDEMSKQQKSAL